MSEGTHRGQCRCGAVRFAAEGSPLVTMACHCQGCQRMSASAFSLSSLYPAERFTIIEGDPVRGGLGTGPSHMFCRSCMSWLYTVPDGMDAFVNVRSPLFEDGAAHRPFLETYANERMEWAETHAPRRFASVPQDEEFGELMAGYAAWDGRVKQ